ncbi:MAG: hypothetical protein KJO62_00080, partial [Gammaproteobacteria bacterium]|nr:hypothetical protein [Gammaproteobacteria bacterium]
FGAARPATGFNADIKALIRCLCASPGDAGTAQDMLAHANAIAAPIDNDLALWAAIRKLRSNGEVVVSVPETIANKYQRKLVARQGAWTVVANAAQAT